MLGRFIEDAVIIKVFWIRVIASRRSVKKKTTVMAQPAPLIAYSNIRHTKEDFSITVYFLIFPYIPLR